MKRATDLWLGCGYGDIHIFLSERKSKKRKYIERGRETKELAINNRRKERGYRWSQGHEKIVQSC